MEDLQDKASDGFVFPTKRASLILLLGKQGSGKTHFLKSFFERLL
jgi:tRNA A37 threonylcarbamoyladenosine biosynthesis protein TsaE